MRHHATVCDPRDPLMDHVLQVEYTRTPGVPPIFDPIDGGDPGYPPEYELQEAITKRGSCCLDRLTPVEYFQLVTEIHNQHTGD